MELALSESIDDMFLSNVLWNSEPLLNFPSMMCIYMLYEPHHEKICLRGFRPGKTQTDLLSYRDKLGSWNFGFSKYMYNTI